MKACGPIGALSSRHSPLCLGWIGIWSVFGTLCQTWYPGRQEKADRKGYPTDVSDEEWSFAAAYLTLLDVTAPQRELGDMFDALRWMARAGARWRMLSNDFPPLELCISRANAGYR